MSQQRERSGSLRRRVISLLLAVVMLVTLAQSAIVSAASYLDPYLEQVVEWGVMRGDIDGNLNPNNPISRAEFVTMINRAYGFSKMGTMPFQDVPETAWYADDVNIAYTTGYIQGTSASTFSPDSSITREQAAVILARILMMQEQVGENVAFSDSREMSDWSRGLIATAADYNLLTGYDDGSFRPQNPITRGEAAILIVRAVGNPIQEAGEYRMGNIWGNVTIASSGVTLRDTVIGGNLYISAGVDLGDVMLENVTVLGEIVVSGGGVSEGGDDSVILRNVTAPKLIVDNLSGQTVSVRLEGDGLIDTAEVRTNAFLADNAKDGCGAAQIRLDGEDGLKLTLAGNIKEVTNVTPGSTVSLASGQAAVINVDEQAVNSTLRIESGALAHEVNLDVATTVTGSGDISSLVVNSSGSTVSMLPDQIVIRPGETANIGGELMDSNAAAESSADPRLSAGYPRISDLAPTSVTAQFAANKKGTIYWAITAVTDGSVAAEDLINPSSYAPKIVKSGSVSITGSGQVNSSSITGLTTNGSYYLSAVFVDGREQRSPLKVISFTTPDNTKPDFASGYPYMSKITSISGQVTTMATKTCRLYWAVLPKGASAPTENDFKANAVTGNLGYGILDVTKNVANTFDVNSVPLEELESYDLYLWLTDVDGGQSSAVKKLSFTTVDGTPPVFNTEPTINKVDKTSVGLYANLNEDGTLYWVIVEQGETYPKPLAGQTGAVDLSSDTAKLQVSAGMNALKSGKVTMTEGKDVSFTISGLEEEKAYDLYYVAQDKAGNYSATVGKITIHTLDNTAPTVTQEFTKYNGTDTTVPLPESDVRLVFSEEVQTADTYEKLVDLYNAIATATDKDAARNKLATALSNAIYLYQVPSGTQPVKLEGYTGSDKINDDWTIDYRYAEIKSEEGKTVVTFPNGTGINLKSGATYYFEIQANTIADTSSAFNVMGRQQLDRFSTVFAQVNISALNENTITSFIPPDGTSETPTQKDVPVDVSWRLTPISTQKVDDSIDWDMLIWSDTSVEFELYYRNTVPAGESGSQAEWKLLGSASITVPDNVTGYRGVSLTRNFLESGSNNPDFDMLNTLKDDAVYEYAISFTKVAGLADRDTWSQRINLKIHVIAGSNNDLGFLSADITEEYWEEALAQGVTNIGLPDDFSLRKQFTDQQAPIFIGDYPAFEAGDSAVEMSLMLDRPGTVYYVVAPLGFVGTTDEGGNVYDSTDEGTINWETLPESGREDDINGAGPKPPVLTSPDYLNIVNASSNYRNEKIKYGSVTCGSSVETELVDGLDKETKYIAYFVLQGTSQTYSRVLAYRFETTEVQKPKITLHNYSPSVNFQTDSTADLDYVLIASNQIPQELKGEFSLDTYVDPAKEDEWNKYIGTSSTGTKTFTVLTALCTTYSNGYSVFDAFAKSEDDSTIRTTVAELISGSTTMGADIAAQDSISLTQANSYRQEIDFTDKMAEATIYYCLATAVSPLGSETSFAGIAGINLPDRTPPELLSVNTTITSPAGATSYSGTVTFVFDEPVYQLVNINGVDQTPMEIWQTKFTISTADQEKAVNLPAIIGSSSPSSFTCEENIRTPSNTLTLTFTDIPLSTTLVLFSNSYICNASSVSTRQILTFTLQTGVPIGNIPNGTGFVQLGQ